MLASSQPTSLTLPPSTQNVSGDGDNNLKSKCCREGFNVELRNDHRIMVFRQESICKRTDRIWRSDGQSLHIVNKVPILFSILFYAHTPSDNSNDREITPSARPILTQAHISRSFLLSIHSSWNSSSASPMSSIPKTVTAYTVIFVPIIARHFGWMFRIACASSTSTTSITPSYPSPSLEGSWRCDHLPRYPGCPSPLRYHLKSYRSMT